jgi:hypothetical protein
MVSARQALKLQALSMCAFAIPLVKDPMRILSKITADVVAQFGAAAAVHVLATADKKTAKRGAKVYLIVNLMALLELYAEGDLFALDVDHALAYAKAGALLAAVGLRVPKLPFALPAIGRSSSKKVVTRSKGVSKPVAKKSASRSSSRKR